VSRTPLVCSELNEEQKKELEAIDMLRDRVVETMHECGNSIVEEDIAGFVDFLNEMKPSNVKSIAH